MKVNKNKIALALVGLIAFGGMKVDVAGMELQKIKIAQDCKSVNCQTNIKDANNKIEKMNKSVENLITSIKGISDKKEDPSIIDFRTKKILTITNIELNKDNVGEVLEQLSMFKDSHDQINKALPEVICSIMGYDDLNKIKISFNKKIQSITYDSHDVMQDVSNKINPDLSLINIIKSIDNSTSRHNDADERTYDRYIALIKVCESILKDDNGKILNAFTAIKEEHCVKTNPGFTDLMNILRVKLSKFLTGEVLLPIKSQNGVESKHGVLWNDSFNVVRELAMQAAILTYDPHTAIVDGNMLNSEATVFGFINMAFNAIQEISKFPTEIDSPEKKKGISLLLFGQEKSSVSDLKC